VCSAWFRAPSDLFVVANEPTAKVLRSGHRNGTHQNTRLPGQPGLRAGTAAPLSAPRHGDRRKVLYVINTGKAKTAR